MAGHSTDLGHCIQFQDTSIMAKKYGHMECIIKAVIEMELHPDNMNKEERMIEQTVAIIK
jgi:hypothetical protein